MLSAEYFARVGNTTLDYRAVPLYHAHIVRNFHISGHGHTETV
jgi:hypothetical protein